MYKNILVALDLNDEASCHKPLLAAVELARTFGARVHVLTVVREVEAILQAKTARSAMTGRRRSRKPACCPDPSDQASDLDPNILVAHGASIYAEILGVAEEAGADLVVVGSHRPAMKDTCSAPMPPGSCATPGARPGCSG